MREKLRNSGIDIIGDVPWGTHICQFYQTKEDLFDILIPYFKAGLENNEFCLWVTSQPLEIKESKEALRKAVPDLDFYLEKGQIEIISYADYYLKDGIFDLIGALNGWTKKINHVLANGYNGLRSSGNSSWLEKKDRSSFTDYEGKVDSTVSNYPTIALCTYSLDELDATEIIDVVVNHQFSLVKREGKWERIESPRRKKVEEAAVQATKNWEYTFDAVPDLIAILDTEFRVVRANRAMAARLGVTPEECTGLTCYHAIHGADKPPSFCPHLQLLEDGLEHTTEVLEDNLGGDFLVSASPLHDSKGQLIGCIHVARDITERKQAEKALRMGEELLRFALEISHTGAWDLDLADHTAYRSLEHDHIFGYEQLLPQWTYEMFLDHVLPEDRSMVEAKFHEATATCSDWNFECRIRRVDGAVRWIWAAGRHHMAASGNLSRMRGIVQDITERKLVEEALRENETRLKVIIANSPDIIFEQDRNLRYTWVFNPAPPLSVSDVLGKTDEELMPPDQAKLLTSIKRRVLEIGVREHAVLMLTPGGESQWFEAIYEPRYDETGNVMGILSYIRNISERKQLEEQTRQRAEEIETIMEVAPVAIWIGHDPQCHNITGNRTANEFYEAKIGENVSPNVTPVRRLFRKGIELVAEELPMQQSALKDVDVRNVEIDVLLPSGEFRGLLGSASPLHDADGRVRGSVGAFIDITERKKAEEALRESEEKYRNFIETAIEGILIVDPEARITYSNEKMAEMLGYTQDEILGRFAWDFADHEDKSIIKLNLEKRRQGINEIYELKLIRKDGSLFWGLVSAKPLFDKAGNFTGSMAMLTDITKWKEAETRLKETLDNLENLVKERTAELEMAYKSLKESEKGLAEAQKMAHIGNWEWDIASDKAYWSEEMYRIFKRDPQKLAPSLDEYLSYIHPDDVEYYSKVNDYTRKVRTSGLDFRIVLANGEERTLHIKSDFIYNDENTPIRVKGIVQDITERESAKQELELSEERYRIITEQTGQLVYDYDPEKNTADWAGNVEELTGFTPEEFKSMSLKFWLSRIHPEDLSTYLEIYDRYMKSGDAYRTEYRFRKKDGEYIYIEDNGICLRDKKSNVHRILGVIKNITERKKAEIFLANIETARKKEIHHRIKNNLQVISSLLDLQAEKFRGKECVEDLEVLKAFRESQDRVMSIALIHEELHEGRGTNKLNISPYLERLVKNLFQTYRLGNAGTSLNIELEENIFFDMDAAVPLGIIINELVSNALKYAFAGKDKGLIEIKLFREESAEYTDNGPVSEREENVTSFVLTVSDNGVGMPQDFSLNKSGTLGLQLVAILADQLGGELKLEKNHGTKFIIKFAIPENK